jgi:hypothetical protein
MPQHDSDCPGTGSSHLPVSGCPQQSRVAGFVGERKAQISQGCGNHHDHGQKQLVVWIGENPYADIFPKKMHNFTILMGTRYATLCWKKCFIRLPCYPIFVTIRSKEKGPENWLKMHGNKKSRGIHNTHSQSSHKSVKYASFIVPVRFFPFPAGHLCVFPILFLC